MCKRARDGALTERDYMNAVRNAGFRVTPRAEHKSWMTLPESRAPVDGTRAVLELPVPMSDLCVRRALDKLHYSPHVTELRLRVRCNLDDHVPLANFFSAAGTAPLIALDLSDSTLDAGALAVLAEWLHRFPCLSVLNLEFALEVGNADIAQFAAALATNSALTTLNLAGAHMSSATMSQLVGALASNSSVTDLDVGDNPFCAAALAGVERHPALRRLRCDGMRMDCADAQMLFAALARLPALRDLTVGKENPDNVMRALRAAVHAGPVRALTILDMPVGTNTAGWLEDAGRGGPCLENFSAVNLPPGPRGS